MTKLLLLDLDGTIREPLSGKEFISHPRDQKIIKGADSSIATYHSNDWLINGITNQGGVEAGYKTLAEAIDECRYTMELFPQIDLIYLCPDFKGKECWLVIRWQSEVEPIYLNWASEFSGTFRKPNSGMIKAAVLNGSWEAVLFVGDRPEDEQAAANAGVEFMWAHEWR